MYQIGMVGEEKKGAVMPLWILKGYGKLFADIAIWRKARVHKCLNCLNWKELFYCKMFTLFFIYSSTTYVPVMPFFYLMFGCLLILINFHFNIYIVI